MPESYAAISSKKFLDADGLTYFARKLNDYPNNDVLEAVIEGIQDALDEKMDSDRVQFGSTADWSSDPSFIPDNGQIIIYTDKGVIIDNNVTKYVPGIKVGDGSAYLSSLPFLGDDQVEYILSALNSHVNNTDIHVSTEDRTRWNNKLNCSVSGETLTLNRL